MSVTPPVGTIAERYVAAVESFVELARTLTPEEWSRPSPCTPGWTARDVLSHVAGIPDDALAGRTDGVATSPWTASQVERNRGFTVEYLLDRWLEQYELFGAVIEEMDEQRPPVDCHTHEHDVRTAVGRPGNRSSALIAEVVPRSLEVLRDSPVAVNVVLDDGTSHGSPADGAEVRVTDLAPFEVFRSRLGRRSRAQVEEYAWTGEPDAIRTAIDQWFIFGPSPDAIEEGEGSRA